MGNGKSVLLAVVSALLLIAGIAAISVLTSGGGYRPKVQPVLGEADGSEENSEGDLLAAQPIAEETPEPTETPEPEPTPFVCPKPADLTWPGSALEDGKVVLVLDPGHGGDDSGTMPKNKSVYEKDINLALVNKMKPLLEERGITVYLTRDSDVFVGLGARADFCNELEADLFVSIHVNSYDESSRIGGLECYYYEESEACKTLAADVVEYLKNNTDIPLRGLRTNDYKVLTHTACTAILVETGYITNPTDAAHLTNEEYQKKLAQALVDAILASAGIEKDEEVHEEAEK